MNSKLPNQPKSQIMFHKQSPPQDCIRRTLHGKMPPVNVKYILPEGEGLRSNTVNIFDRNVSRE